MSGFGSSPFIPTDSKSVTGDPYQSTRDQYGKITNKDDSVPNVKSMGALVAGLKGSGVGDSYSEVNVTNSTGVTHLASSFVSGVISRSGPTAAYSDTTPTAGNIIGALNNPVVGESYWLIIRNTVAVAQTMVAGNGVTLAGTTSIAASTVRLYMITITNVAVPAITITGIMTGGL